MATKDRSATQLSINKPRERSNRAKIGECGIILVIGIIGIIIEFQLIAIDPNEQYIPGFDEVTDTITNYNYAYPDLESVISTAGLMAIVFVPWYGLFIISTICLNRLDKQFNKSHILTHLYLMTRMIFFSFCVCLIIVDLMKLFVGAPRPYFIDLYEANKLNEVDRSEMVDARLSFPSGHAAYSWNSLFLLTIMFYNSWRYTQTMYYIQTKIPIGMRTSNPHSYYLLNFWWLLREIPSLGIILVFVPTYVAIWGSLTRITDYKHFAADIVGGALIGGFIAYLVYLLFYNEMYLEFNYRLKLKIEQSYTNKSGQYGSNDNINGHQNGNAAAEDNKSVVIPLSIEDKD